MLCDGRLAPAIHVESCRRRFFAACAPNEGAPFERAGDEITSDAERAPAARMPPLLGWFWMTLFGVLGALVALYASAAIGVTRKMGSRGTTARSC